MSWAIAPTAEHGVPPLPDDQDTSGGLAGLAVGYEKQRDVIEMLFERRVLTLAEIGMALPDEVRMVLPDERRMRAADDDVGRHFMRKRVFSDFARHTQTHRRLTWLWLNACGL